MSAREGDFWDALRRRLRTPRQITQESRASWERRKALLPSYTARELLTDYRGLFSRKDELTKMDGFLAQHGHMATNFRGKYPHLVIDVRAARRTLEENLRIENLSFLERARVRRNFRASLSRLETQGGKRSLIQGTLTLNWPLKSLYRFGKLQPATGHREFSANGLTQAIVDEARRQNRERQGRGQGRHTQALFYHRRADPRQGVEQELTRLQAAGLARKTQSGVWQLDGYVLSEKLKTCAKNRPLLSPETLLALTPFSDSPSSSSGWERVGPKEAVSEAALAELEALYPRASRKRRGGYEINRTQLCSALGADKRQFIAHWVETQHAAPAVAKADERMAQALFFATPRGELAIYIRTNDPTRKAAPIERYLRGLALDPNISAVKLGRGGTFILHRKEALSHLTEHRKALFAYEVRRRGRDGVASLSFPDTLVEAFSRHGKPLSTGAWILTPRDAATPRREVLIWQLHRSAALHSTALTQTADGSYQLSREAARSLGLPGTPRWAKTQARDFAGLDERTRRVRPEQDALSVEIKGNADRGIAPLTGKLAKTTQKTYAAVLSRQQREPVETLPQYLCHRVSSLSREAWWLEHAVTRRKLRALEMAAAQAGDHELRQKLYTLRFGIERMSYIALRETPVVTRLNPTRKPLDPEAVKALKQELKNRGDMTLYDAVILSEQTGLRPEELARGVKLDFLGKATVRVHIEGAKRGAGTQGEARFGPERGRDRVLEVTSRELAEVADRRKGYFRPECSKDALRMRLREVSSSLPNAGEMSFYSFRHAFKSRCELKGYTRAEIATFMGHRSLRSQSSYGIKHG